jgi:hypothetical protein
MENIILQSIGITVAVITLLGWWVYRQNRDVRNDLGNKIDNNHRELLTFLQDHTHSPTDVGRAQFHKLPGAGD